MNAHASGYIPHATPFARLTQLVHEGTPFEDAYRIAWDKLDPCVQGNRVPLNQAPNVGITKSYQPGARDEVAQRIKADILCAMAGGNETIEQIRKHAGIAFSTASRYLKVMECEGKVHFEPHHSSTPAKYTRITGNLRNHLLWIERSHAGVAQKEGRDDERLD